MNEQRKVDTRERVQIIALGVHGITDRFSVHEQAFGIKLKEASIDLIEDTAIFEVARTRDAAGTAQIIHKLLCEADTLRSLLSFVKNRGLAREATVDILVWEIEQLLGDLEREDARFEEHVSRHHPKDMPVHAGQVTASVQPPAPTNTTPPAPAPKRVDSDTEIRTLDSDRKSFDPLLGPDSTAAFRARAQAGKTQTQSGPATAVKEAPRAVATPPITLPTVAPLMQSFTEIAPEQAPAPQVGVSDALSERQRTIIGLFKVEAEAPLKRVMSMLPNVSEKTVRNDLLDLVRKGFLQRIGKAPRSKYVLAR